MSLRRDLRKLLRAATKALNAYAKTARRFPAVDAGDGGKGADALGKALGEFQQDPTLAALDTTPPKSYAAFGEKTRPGIVEPASDAPPA